MCLMLEIDLSWSLVDDREMVASDSTTSHHPPPPPSFERIDSIDEKLREHPCFLFIARPDLYNYAKVIIQKRDFGNILTIWVLY